MLEVLEGHVTRHVTEAHPFDSDGYQRNAEYQASIIKRRCKQDKKTIISPIVFACRRLFACHGNILCPYVVT